MPRGRRGTEYEGVPEIVPPGQSIPVKQARGLANQGGGTNVIVQEITAKGSIVLRCRKNDNAQFNTGGSSITVKDLSTVNAAFGDEGQSFPGGASDDNYVIWQWLVPSNMAVTPNMKARLHVIGE